MVSEDGGSTFFTTIELGANDVSYTYEDPSPGRELTFDLLALHEATPVLGQPVTNASQPATATESTKVAAPTVTTSVKSDAVILNWSKIINDNVDGYKVERSADGKTGWTTVTMNFRNE